LHTGPAQGLEHRFQRLILGAEIAAPNQPDKVPHFAHPACARTLRKREAYPILGRDL